MEIVLSPGRFGDETPGVPFQKEEIREWSHVDRLTGMLERARIETGRWQSSNPEAAKSYGKVIDSRERNSADGSIVQRARRQVEIFQSQGRGRSVQVVRASQWSSSRVTDSASTGLSILPVLDQRQITQGEVERNTGEKSVKAPRPAVETTNDRKSRQEAISERLSALLGAFPYPVTSSTVPLRRIDSRYSSRAPIIFANAKRSNSNEDVAIFARENITNDGQERVERVASDVDRSMLKYGAMSLANFARSRDRDEASAKRCNNSEESTCKSAGSAIQLLPSSKSNTTVVNLMGDTRARRDNEILDDKRSKLNWIPQTSPKNSQRVSSNEGSPSQICQKLPKRVGFCKTEIHFVADSGKVNIVETDEKPPPTNKFRRKKRLVATNKIIPPSHVVAANTMTYEGTKINDEAPDLSNSALLADRDIELCEENAKNEHHRGHTTTVKLGTEIMRNQDRGKETMERAGSSESGKKIEASTKSKRKDDSSTEDYGVICTDAENNQVVLKVVTTHEPTIARVMEGNDHFSKRPKKPMIKKKAPQGQETPERKKSQTEHTYVNVFAGSNKNVPIYENFRITNTRKAERVENPEPTKKEAKVCPEKLSPEKSCRVPESKSQVSPPCDTSATRDLANLEKTKSSVDGRTTAETRPVASSSADKKSRIDKKVAENSSVTSRLRASKVAKSETATKRLGPVKSDVSPNDRDSRRSTGTHDGKVEASPRSSTREISSSSTRTRNNNENTRRKPMEVVYQTAVYNMKNAKLPKPHKKGNKESSKGPRYINELICGAKTKSKTKSSDSKSKTSSTVPHSAQNKGASQAIRHWK